MAADQLNLLATEPESPGEPTTRERNQQTDPTRRTRGLALVPAAYSPDTGRPLCPNCWSTPEVESFHRGLRAQPRGWGTSAANETEIVGGASVAVIETIYRCANHACPTAVSLRMLVTGGYVPRLVDARRLAGNDAARFRAGVIRRDGIWVARDGAPRTAGEQRELF